MDKNASIAPPVDLTGADRSAAMALRLSHDELARARFVVGLKRLTNFELAERLRRHYRAEIEPGLEAAKGAKLDDLDRADRKLAKSAMADDPLYRIWSGLSYRAQSMMWEWVERVLDHDLPRLQRNAEMLARAPDRLGSLTLDPELDLPRNIANVEIHRQPGGLCFESDERDITAGAIYDGGSLIYSAGKGRKSVAGRTAADFLKSVLDERWPGFAPKRILEIGCGTGRNTVSYTRLYPDAHVTGIDCAPGLLRFAHAYAEAQRVAIDFIQMDLTRMSFPDGAFDLVVSHIVGHETTQRGLPRMIAESHRVLAPGGIALHLDVVNQPAHSALFDQVLNDWQVRYNGEPFWMGWADADIRGLMLKAGFPSQDILAEVISRADAGAWFCHGGRRTAPSGQVELAA